MHTKLAQCSRRVQSLEETLALAQSDDRAHSTHLQEILVRACFFNLDVCTRVSVSVPMSVSVSVSMSMSVSVSVSVSMTVSMFVSVYVRACARTFAHVRVQV